MKQRVPGRDAVAKTNLEVDAIQPPLTPPQGRMAFDSDPTDEELDDDETTLAYDAQDDDEPAQDDAGDDEDAAEGDDSDQEEPPRHGTPQAGTAQRWQIILAERNEAGDWNTVVDPVPDARFPTMDLAFDYATRLNCRDFGKRLDWMCNPGRAWVAVRVGTRGQL